MYLTSKAVDERIFILRIKTKFRNISFINVHAPTDEKEAFYHITEDAYDVASNDIKVLMGYLTFKSLPLTLHTTRFNIQKFCMVITLHLCDMYGSQKKQ